MSDETRSGDQFTRLEQALNAWLEYVDLGARDPDEFLAGVDPDLRLLLEPMLEVSPPAPDESGTPERVGSFRIVRLLGRGGMGVVYEAMDEALERRVALKVLGPFFAGSKSSLERFRREGAAAARLRHSGIVKVYGIGEDDGVHWIAMELVEGENLSDRLRRDGPLGVLPDASRAAELAELGAQVAEALDYAHAQSVVHRDIKPHNILIDGDGRARLVDFGLAKLLDRESLSVTGEFAGSLAYASPEQVSGSRDLDARSDLWSLGIVLYEGLVGRRPFEAETHEAVVRNILTREPAVPEGPRDLQTICLKALEKDPKHRFTSARAMAADLRRFLDHEPIHAMLPGTVSRLMRYVRRRRGLVVWSIAAVTLVAVTFGLLLEEKEHAGQLVASARNSLEQLERIVAQEAGSTRRGHTERHRDRVEHLVEESERLLALEPDDPELLQNVALAQDHAGRLYQLLKFMPAAEAAHGRAAELFGRLLQKDPGNFRARQSRAACLHNRHIVHRAMGRGAAAGRDLDAAMAEWERVLAGAPDSAAGEMARVGLAQALTNRATARIASDAATKDLVRAVDLWREALRYPAGALARMAALETMRTRARNLFLTGNLVLADRVLDDVLARIEKMDRDVDHVALEHVHIETLRERATIAVHDGRAASAKADLEAAIRLARSLAGDGAADFDILLSMVQTDLAQILLEAGAQPERTRDLLVDSRSRLFALQQRSPHLVDVRRELARVMDRQAVLLIATAQPDAVEAAMRSALRMHEELERDQPSTAHKVNVASAEYSYGRWLCKQKRDAEARPLLDAAHRAMAEALRACPRHPVWSQSFMHQSQALLDANKGRGRHDELVAIADRMVAAAPTHPNILRMAIRALDVAVISYPGSSAKKTRYGLPLVAKATRWIHAADRRGVQWRKPGYVASLHVLRQHKGLLKLLQKKPGERP